ncbi:hypothetical protein RhiirB3_496339 [Rhizophagus irregularis]|nr:hypothetical protein RhiirB3_496339 [Rhizophagus irregularis]
MNSEYLSSLEEFEQDASDNDECSTSKVILKVNDSFNDWISVQTVVDLYAKQNGFVANKIRKEVDSIDNSIIRHHVYTCWKSGIHKPKKVEDMSLHRNCKSNKTNCPWQANFYLAKWTNVIRLTKLEDTHNHQCDPVSIELAPKNLRFPQQILDKIEHYTRNGHLSAGQQYNLLINEFPQFNIKKKNLYNAIQKFCGVRTHDETDAATMFLYLLKQRKNDSGYNSWARYSIAKTFTAGVESTQRVESINGVIKKLVDRGTLLKELVIAIERELDKESYYTRINDYYGTNPSIGLPSTYNTIFKEIDLVLQAYLSPIPLSIQRTQMNQALLYQGTLISFEYIKEDDGNFEVVSGERKHSSVPLSYITYLRTDDVYTPAIREQVSKKVKYGNTMSVAKTSVQIAIKEDVTPEFIGLLTEFIMKYRRRTGLSIENIKNDISISGTLLQDPQRSFTENSREPLAELPEISNPKYLKTKGHPSKRLKSSIEESKNTSVGNIQRTCRYCLVTKGHNIQSCAKYKADMVRNKENI